MKKYAVIVAGGYGSRMGSDTPKQFLELCGRPILWYTLNTFLSAYEDMPIVLVAPEAHRDRAREVVAATALPARIEIVAGGATRFESVRKGLAAIAEESVVFVHDGVRCLVRRELVHRCYEGALTHGSAIPVVDSRDSVRLVSPEAGNVAIDRYRVKLVQTPQTFLSRILIPAYQVAFRESFTDEASVVEAAGHAIHLVEGAFDNIKITTPVDLVTAAYLLQQALPHV